MPPTRKRRITRWTLAVAGFVAAGAALNVLVAWGCMLWSPLVWTNGPATLSTTGAWSWPLTPAQPTVRLTYQASGFGVSGTQTDDEMFSSSGASSSAEFRAGWPLTCMRWTWADQFNEPAASQFARTDKWMNTTGVDVNYRLGVTALRVRPLGSPGRMPYQSFTWPRVPIDPLWGPLLINTVVWVVVPASPWLTAWWLVRRRRLRVGRCSKCLYPIGVSPVCTECGAALPAQRRPATP